MSLQDAANYFNQRRNSPVDRGISAGRAAYEGDRAPQRSGIGPVPIADVKSSVQQAIEQAAAQRQVLADTAQKQALGLYPNTGTSAAIYNYLRGTPGAKYPVNPILAGQPGSALESSTISKPYEGATKVGGPTQTEVAKKGDEKPPISRSGYGPQAVRQPGMLDSLLGLALPAYLGYKAYNYLTGPANYAPVVDLSTYGTLAQSYPEAVASLQAYEAGLPAAFEVPDVQSILDQAYSQPGVQIADATAGSGLEYLTSTGAGGIDWTNPANWDTAGLESAGLGSADMAATAAGTEGFGALALEYGPYVAAAMIADQLTGGGLSEAGQDIISGVSGAVEDFGSAVQNVGSGVSNWISSWANGGAVNGISAALPQKYNLGGYSDGGRLLKGPGDGVSDDIPATIGKNKQPARLADGEFVVPARIVSELGNGSTEAGARKLYAMMDRIQNTRKKSIGKGKVAVNSRADKNLPA